jgi:glucose-1-phosphate cytidylyltransferase
VRGADAGSDRPTVGRAMKVVLFCGGFGMRMRDYSETIPKPMVPIGYRPILWHVMRYYAHFGHKDFILCLGYRGDVVKDYFLNYKEWLSNDFVLSGGGADVELLSSDIDDWRVTFVDTGTHANIGERLRAVRPYLDGEEVFLANYSDGLSDVPLDRVVDGFRESGSTASFVSATPSHSFHVVTAAEDGVVKAIEDVTQAGLWINAGYFVFSTRIFDVLRAGDELVAEPFARLIDTSALRTYRHDGFFVPMDTFKDRQLLEDLYSQGRAPWELWRAGTR